MAAPRRSRRPDLLARPLPPESLRTIALEDADAAFLPAPDVARWIRRAFVESIHGSPVTNADHAHLALARLLVIWTNAKATKQGRIVLGTAEIFNPKGGAWQVARQTRQVLDWYPEGEGAPPDFVVTLSAPYCAAVDDAAFCALVEHELMHCAQAVDQYGAPRFNRDTGVPIWTIRGHDVEEFVGIVRRYGAQATGTRAMVEAASQWEREPVFSDGDLAGVCGVR